MVGLNLSMNFRLLKSNRCGFLPAVAFEIGELFSKLQKNAHQEKEKIYGYRIEGSDERKSGRD